MDTEGIMVLMDIMPATEVITVTTEEAITVDIRVGATRDGVIMLIRPTVDILHTMEEENMEHIGRNTAVTLHMDIIKAADMKRNGLGIKDTDRRVIGATTVDIIQVIIMAVAIAIMDILTMADTAILAMVLQGIMVDGTKAVTGVIMENMDLMDPTEVTIVMDTVDIVTDTTINNMLLKSPKRSCHNYF